MARPRKGEQIDISGRAVAAVIELLDDNPNWDVGEVTLARIAARIGCRAPALYNHFANRDDLLARAHDAGFARLYGEKLAVAGAAPGRTAFARLREGGMAYIRFALDHPGLYRLMFAPPQHAARDGNPFTSDAGRRCLDVLTASVAACQREGRLMHLPPERLAFVLWSSVHGAASLILQNRAPLPVADADSAEAAAVIAVDTMMDLLAAAPAVAGDH